MFGRTIIKGTKTEQLADLVFQREGYVKYDAKIGSNNGFDGVYIKGDPANPTDIIINEAKQLKSTGNIKLAGATPSKASQMSDTWINQTIVEMQSNSVVSSLGNILQQNLTKINKAVTVVDKTTGEIVILKLGSY